MKYKHSKGPFRVTFEEQCHGPCIYHYRGKRPIAHVLLTSSEAQGNIVLFKHAPELLETVEFYSREENWDSGTRARYILRIFETTPPLLLERAKKKP